MKQARQKNEERKKEETLHASPATVAILKIQGYWKYMIESITQCDKTTTESRKNDKFERYALRIPLLILAT